MDHVAITPGARATFFDLCYQGTPCPNKHPLTRPAIRVGEVIEYWTIGAIKCDRFSRDISGWMGDLWDQSESPKYIARKGKWNCIASTSKQDVLNTMGLITMKRRGPIHQYVLIQFTML